MEKNAISPGRMAMADLFGPLTTPISALDFKDKVKITIKRNAGVKCLRVPKPCGIRSISSAREPGGRIRPNVSLPRPTTGLQGAKPYVRMSPFIMSGGREDPKPGNMMVKADPWKGRRSATIEDAHIKSEPGLCESAGGAHSVQTHNKVSGGAHSVQTHNKEESLPSNGAGGTETDPTQIKTEECFPSATDDLSDTQYISVHIKEEPLTDDLSDTQYISVHIKEEPLTDDLSDTQYISVHVKEEPLTDDLSDTQYISVHIKEEPLTDEEQLSDHMAPNIKTEPDHLTHNSFYIKEEPLSDKEDQIITIKIKEEPTSSKEESDEEEGVHIREESGGPSTSSKIWPSAPQKDRMLHRTLPLVIRTPHITERKTALPKKIKTSLLKKLIELDTPSNDNAHKMRTLTCTPVKMYKCSKCGRYFTSRLRLRRHHLAHKKYKVACPDCGRLFACKATVLRHQVVHSKEKPFPCSFCEKSFSTDKGREIHQRRHTGDKPFGCSDCGKHFLFKSQLKTHQMIHTGERYSCHECGRCYLTKPGLVLHMRIHSGDFPYWCPECGKGFVQKSILKNHLHTHSNEKPFTCLECGRGFRQKYNLKQHMNVHAAKECEKYSCPECGKSYKRKADYRWHMLIHLGEK